MTFGIGELADRADAVAELAERATHTIPFYAHHFDGHDPASFANLPTVSKQAFGAWGQRPLAAPDDRPARYCATSGTTGPRLLVGFSNADWERLRVQLAERGRTIGLGRDDLVANTHGYGLWIGGPTLDPFLNLTAQYQVQRGDSLSRIANRTRPQGISLDQMLVGLYKANPQAFAGGNMNRLKSGQILSIPEVATVRANRA